MEALNADEDSNAEDVRSGDLCSLRSSPVGGELKPIEPESDDRDAAAALAGSGLPKAEGEGSGLPNAEAGSGLPKADEDEGCGSPKAEVVGSEPLPKAEAGSGLPKADVVGSGLSKADPLDSPKADGLPSADRELVVAAVLDEA